MVDTDLKARAQAVGAAILPLTQKIGAEVEGLDLSRPLSPEARELIYQALLKHRVVFFRDQPLTADQQVAFAGHFGEPVRHPMSTHANPAITNVYSRGDTRIATEFFHSDSTFRVAPPMGSVLRAVQTPEVGGDTVFTSAISAYEALDEATKARIETLTALHDCSHVFDYGAANAKAGRTQYAKDNPSASHPVVRIHPDTGERLIYVNPIYTVAIEGVSAEESAALLNRLYAELLRPEHQCRFRWRDDSIAFWDNRATQHCAVPGFDGDVERRLERVDLGGQRPFGPAERRKAQAEPA